MLNRLYIVFGGLMILVIVGAFIVPRFIDWSARRGQMEALAAEALGTEVRIAGTIDFVLLPQPQLRFTDVIVGPAGAPVAEIASAEAEFSLMDFLRDRFQVTRLVVQRPQLNIRIDEYGQFVTPLRLPESVSASNVSIANADIEQGTIRFTDGRTGDFLEMFEFNGTLQLSALRGPFALQGAGDFQGVPYRVRLNTSQMNPEGAMQLVAFVGPLDGQSSLTAEGTLRTGAAPEFQGRAVFRQAPPRTSTLGDVRGSLVIEAEVDLSPERLRLTNYTWVPDENRAGTRLTGAAVVHLGAGANFDAVVSGGVVALAPRDVRQEEAGLPYELLRLLDELPPPPMPPIPGEVGVDIAELNLRAFALREVRFDARSDGEGWTLSSFTGRLPGDSALSLQGRATAQDGHPRFAGNITLSTNRLDALAQTWRRPEDSNPLFGLSGSLAAEVEFTGEALSLREGVFDLAGVRSAFAVEAVLGAPGRLDVAAELGAFNPQLSAALAALLPAFQSDPAFASSFGGGRFELSAERATLFNLSGSRLAARGTWDGAGIRFNQLAAADLGGSSFTLAGAVAGTMAAPMISGSGQLSFGRNAVDGALPLLFDVAGAAPPVRNLLTHWLPANVQISLSEPDANQTQQVAVSGRVGGADISFDANLARGIASIAAAPLGARMQIRSDTADAVAALFGLPSDGSLDGGPAQMTVVADGAPMNSMDVQITVLGVENRLQFSGSMILSDPANPRGRGQLEFDLDDASGWATLLGAGGIYIPPVAGAGELSFVGTDSITARLLNFDAGGASVTGDLARSVQGNTTLISGGLNVDRIDVSALLAGLAGVESLTSNSEIWPDGPFAFSSAGRDTRGRVRVTSPLIVSEDTRLASRAQFDFVWDEANLRVRNFSAAAGDGEIGLEIGFCCNGAPSTARQLNGRATFDRVSADALLPTATADVIDGDVTGAIRFNGTGDSFAEIVAGLAGEGTLTVSGLSIAGFNPNAFAVMAGEVNVIEAEAEVLTAVVADALELGPFTAVEVDAVLTLGGGALRTSNLAAENPRARLFGGMVIDLTDLGLSGEWTMTPRGSVDAAGLITEATSRITARLGGTLLAPSLDLDLGPMVDAIQVRALELEVDRLERLRAEDEARAAAAAEERARQMADEARQRAEDAAQAAAEEQARRDAEARARREELDRLRQDPGPSLDPLLRQNAPLDLLSPGVQVLPNQPLNLNGGSFRTLN